MSRNENRAKLMRLKICILIGCGFLHSGLGYAITEQALKSHVAFLSSDLLEGRLTGSKGEKLAMVYAANIFHRLGLEPAGDHGTFFQAFEFTSGVSLGKNNSFTVTNRNGNTQHLKLDQDWRPLSFSNNQSFENTELIFAGYGIKAPALAHLPAYNSYDGLDVKNKWVIVFRYAPEKITNEKRHQLMPYSSLRYKAFTAKEKGAKGIIFVSGPNSHVKNELAPLSIDTSLSNSGIVALSIKDAVANQLLVSNGYPLGSLEQWQSKLDSGEQLSFVLTNIKIAGHIHIEQKKQLGRNVLAKLSINKNNAPMIVIGAHADHLGRGESSGTRSKEHEINLIHHGADDNASGVAGVLEAASTLEHLKAQGKLHGNKDILFAIWSGEELGLLGSSHFVKNLTEKSGNKSLRPSIDTYINLDMIGRLRKNLILQGVGSSASWPALIKLANQTLTLPLVTQNDPYLPTDSTSFYLHGIPTLNLFTGSHDEYHTPRDKLETLNFQGIESISTFLVDLALALESSKLNLIDYQQVQKTSHQRGFRVYLGTIPDYASVDLIGVKLSGVTRNSPAEKAGLKQEDVIVELAGKQIHDIYDYTFVLSALSVGDSAALVVQRGPKKVHLTIVPQSRE